MWDAILEALRQVFKSLGIDLAKGRIWIVHEGDWLGGRRRTVRIGYDAEGHEIGRSVTDQTDDGLGHKTTTTTYYDGEGHEARKIATDKFVDPDGHKTTHTTVTDPQGHVISSN
jgi:hypothetical protein